MRALTPIISCADRSCSRPAPVHSIAGLVLVDSSRRAPSWNAPRVPWACISQTRNRHPAVHVQRALSPICLQQWASAPFNYLETLAATSTNPWLAKPVHKILTAQTRRLMTGIRQILPRLIVLARLAAQNARRDNIARNLPWHVRIVRLGNTSPAQVRAPVSDALQEVSQIHYRPLAQSVVQCATRASTAQHRRRRA